MADPLSISTAIVTFAGASIKTITEINNIVNGFKTADEDIGLLVSEMQDLENVLRKLSDSHQSTIKTNSSNIKDVSLAPLTLKTLQKDLSKLKALLLDLQCQTKGSRFQRFKARYKFIRGSKPTIDALISRIKVSKSSLLLALTVLIAARGEETSNKLMYSHNALKNLTRESEIHSCELFSLQQSLNDPTYGLQAIGESSRVTTTGIERVEQYVSNTYGNFQSLASSVSRASKDVSQIKQSLISIDQKTRLSRASTLPKATNELYHIIPYPKNDHFIGRSDLLCEIEMELLPAKYERQIFTSIALCGLPGVGKTQTALQFVYRNQKQYPMIFWISASNKDKIILGYDDIARSLGLSRNIASADQEESTRFVKLWLSSTERRWLLVFDNVERIEDIAPFWISAQNGSVLVTAQDPTSARALVGKTCQISPFTPREGIDLIETVAKTTGVVISTSEAGQIAKTLGYHPLAINQMANFIIDSGCSVSSFLKLYAQREESNMLQGIDCKSPWYQNTVAAAFDLIIERAGDLGTQAAAVLEVFSLFDPDKIQEEIFSHDCLNLSSGVQRLLALKDLRRMALLNDNTEKDTVSVHRLVQDAVLRKLQKDCDRATQAFSTAISLLRQVFPLHGLSRDHMTESWARCEAFLSHVLSLHARYKDVHPLKASNSCMEFVELLYSCAWYLCERGRFDISSSLIETAETLYHTVENRPNDLFLADLRTVKLYYVNETDHHNPSIGLAREALNIREEAVRAGLLEIDHPNRANSFMNLGVMFTKVDPAKAIELHMTALSIRNMSDRYRNDQVHGLALNYLNLGRSYWCAGKLDEAADSFEKCLTTIQIREDICGERFALSGWALWALANVQIDRGRLDDALILHTESMELNEKILGPFHLKTAASYHKMAWLLWQKGEMTRSRDILKLAFSIYEERAEDLTAERARSKWLLSQIMKESRAEHGHEEDWVFVRQEAQELRAKALGYDDNGGDKQEDYDSLVAYFYR